MVRRRRHLEDDSSEDSSGEDENDLFDVEDDANSPVTDATSVEDLDVSDANVDDDVDVEDQITLFSGNVHPPEYYRQSIEEFNESTFNSEDYSPGTNVLLDAVEEQWHW
jgi:hypothetical protein